MGTCSCLIPVAAVLIKMWRIMYVYVWEYVVAFAYSQTAFARTTFW